MVIIIIVHMLYTRFLLFNKANKQQCDMVVKSAHMFIFEVCCIHVYFEYTDTTYMYICCCFLLSVPFSKFAFQDEIPILGPLFC